MPIRREFLGGEHSAAPLRPALAAAADVLLNRYATKGQARLGAVVVVLPTSRAGRRLLELLVEQCEERGLVLEPPRIVTVGSMPEHLYEIKKPLASELTQRLAWAEALRTTSKKRLANLLPHPPSADDWQSWLELGALVQQQHRELAADRLDFAGVLKEAKKLPGFDEEPRWKALADVQTRYLALLDSLDVWDVQTARLYAINERECQIDSDVLLIGVSDMNAAMRAMLDQVASRVTVLVHAPQSWSDRFDAYGCVLPDAWRDEHLAFDDDKILRADSPADQAYVVAEQLAAFKGKYRADEITLGLGDPKLNSQLSRQLKEFDVDSRSIEGRDMATTGPYLLLNATREYLRAPTFAAFAALVRHPDLYAWLRKKGVSHKLLTELDEMQSTRLPAELVTCEAWLSDKWPIVAAALEQVCGWLANLRGREQKLALWIEPLEAALVEIYRDRTFQRHDAHDHATLEACEHLHDGLAEFAEIPASLAPSVNASEALRMTLDAVRASQIAPPADDQAIEMLGWFELPLDDAPVLIMTSFNEGFVPSSHGADMFLPNRLRQQLGLNHSERLYARDAYATSILLATRDVTWIVGKHDSERNPLSPSRLLFATDRETIAKRARQFFGEEAGGERPRLLLGGAFKPLQQSRLFVPAPRDADKLPEYLRVTDFRTYLTCPYRFYLKRLLKLSSLADAAQELDALQFGSLLHAVLQAFGQHDEARQIADERRLADWLANELYRIATDTWGSSRRPAMNVQIEHARSRLTAFARWQAARASEGWMIKHVEYPIEQVVTFGEHTIELHGAIDRIDVHQERNEWMVFDYKSGDAGEPPTKTHRLRDEWLDLQLPLYRKLVTTKENLAAPPGVGYIVLPKRSADVGAHLAEWDHDEWQSAEGVAQKVVAAIFARQFWPPSYEPRALSAELAPICQDLVAGRQLAELAGAAP